MQNSRYPVAIAVAFFLFGLGLGLGINAPMARAQDGSERQVSKTPVVKVPINADQVDGLHAGTTPGNGVLLALDGAGKFPINVIPQGVGSNLDADSVDKVHAAMTPAANSLLALDSSAKFPLSVIPQGAGSGLNADTLDGIDSSAFALAGHNHDTSYVKKTGDAINGNLKVTGNVSADGNGAVKAGVFAYCSSSGSAIMRSFNNVNGVPITIINGPTNGSCTIDFGFDLGSRFVSATPYGNPTQAQRGVSFDFPSGSRVRFAKFVTTTGELVNGDISVLIY